MLELDSEDYEALGFQNLYESQELERWVAHRLHSISEKGKSYYHDNKERIKAAVRARYEANIEKMKAQRKARYAERMATDPDYVRRKRERAKASRDRSQKSRAEYKREWRLKNLERERAKQRVRSQEVRAKQKERAQQ